MGSSYTEYSQPSHSNLNDYTRLATLQVRFRCRYSYI